MSWPQMLPVPLVGRDEAREHAHGGGLAGAVRAEETQDFARLHAESEVVDGQQAVVVFGQVLRLDHGAWSERSSRAGKFHGFRGADSAEERAFAQGDAAAGARQITGL